VITHVIEIQIVLLKIKRERRGDDEYAAPHTRTECLVQATNGLLVNPHARLLLVIEDQHTGALEVAVQGNTANLVRLIAALEQLQGEEPPRFPRQLAQLREIV